MQTVLIPHLKKGTKLKPSDVLPFDWDEQPIKVVKTPEQIQSEMQKWQKIDAQEKLK